MKKFLLYTTLFTSLIPSLADAQQVVGFILNGGVGTPVAVSSANPLPVNATFSGATPFAPTSATSNAIINATNASLSTALPGGTTQVLTNSGTKIVYFTLSVGAGTATTAGYPLISGATVTINPGSNTFINTITGGTDTTTLLVSGGSGSFQGAGGGGSSGGGGAITIASGAVASGAYSSGAFAAGSGSDGWNVIEGVKATDTACASFSTTGCSILSVLKEIAQQAENTNASAVNLSQINGSAITLGNGVTTANTPRINIASDNTPFSVNTAPFTTEGTNTSSTIVANNTTSVAVDASPGTLYSAQVFNNSATIAYIKYYDASQGSTTCGTGTPKIRVMIPANTSGAGATVVFGGGHGVKFTTAITRCVTTGIADADTTAPAASTYIVNSDYQ